MSLYFSIADTSSCMLLFQITPSPKTRKEKKEKKKKKEREKKKKETNFLNLTYFVMDIFVADQVKWTVAQ